VLVALDYLSTRERTPEKVRGNPELARLMSLKEQYGVPSFPTMLVLDAEGNQIAKIVGYSGEKPAAYTAKVNLPK
jgi:thioredoxin-related protein